LQRLVDELHIDDAVISSEKINGRIPYLALHRLHR